MRREYIVNLVILAVVAALVAWVAMNTYWTEVSVPTPLQGDAAQNPYYSVQRLVETLGIRARQTGSLRSLPRDAVVLVNDLRDDLRHEHIESLQSWVESGGRLIVAGDTLLSSRGLQTWSGITLTLRDPDPADAARGRVSAGTDSDENCSAMTVRVEGAVKGEPLQLCAPASEFAFASKRSVSWSLSDAHGMKVLRVPIGRGEFTVFGPRQILDNRALPIRDHAQAFIDAARLRRGDELLILSPTHAEPLPALLWRLAAPALVFLGAAALLLILRNLPRFGPPAPVPSPVRRSLAEQIRANARFAERTGSLGSLRAAVRRALDETARRQIAGFGSLNARQRAGALASRTGIDAAALGAALTADAAGDVRVQRGAIELLEASRRILVESDRPSERNRA